MFYLPIDTWQGKERPESPVISEILVKILFVAGLTVACLVLYLMEKSV